MLLLLNGCSTLYVMNKRQEWKDKRENTSIYGDGDVYPALYRATYITYAEEIPTWWWPFNKTDPSKSYIASFWLIGAPLSIVDLPISMVSDTLMLPYDAYWVLEE